MDFQSVSRFIFLILITCLSVYFIYVNKNFQQIPEHFKEAPVTQKPTPVKTGEPPKQPADGAVDLNDLSQNTDAQNKQIITEIYMNLFKEKPVDEEISFYLDYLKSRNISKKQLEDVIATTAPVLRKTIPDSAFKSTVTYGTEDAVILAYNEVLGRNPSQKELAEYAEKMSKQKEFTMDRLIQLLVASDEYVRLQKLQLNSYNAGLLGGVTDRQISLTVDQIFSEVSNKELDSETKQFLKKKFIEFKLDESKLRTFIKNYVSNSPTCNEKPTSDKPQLVLQEQLKKAENDQAKEKFANSNPNNTTSGKQGQTQGGQQQGGKGNDQQCQSPVYVVMQPNQDIINSLLQNMNKESDYYVDSQSVLDTINKKAQCTFDKNTQKQKDETLLADELNNRNFEQLKSACTRNSAFANSDSDYVLRPDQKWSVPAKRPPVCNPTSKCQVTDSTDQTALIGTLIKDADKTSVGSILPYLPPR